MNNSSPLEFYNKYRNLIESPLKLINICSNDPYPFSCYHNWNTHLSDVLLLQTLEAAETSDG